MKKLSRCLISLALSLLMVLGAMVPAAAASTEDGLPHFEKARSYAGFSDVTEADWFYSGVSSAYEYGLVDGTGNGAFSPRSNISIAETLVVACRIHSSYYEDGAAFPAGSGPWYQPYADYAVQEGIIGAEEYRDSYTAPATRAQFAMIMAACLPEEAYPAINSVTRIPDVEETDPWGKAVYLLYNAGVVCGNDRHRYLPDQSITRGEAATILKNVVDPSLRAEFSILPYEAFSYDDVLTSSPETVEDYRADWRYMMKNALTDYTVTRSLPAGKDYHEAFEAMISALKEGYDLAAEDYFQYQAFYGGYGYEATVARSASGSLLRIRMKLTARDGLTGDALKQAISWFEKTCADTVESCYAGGTLTASSSREEIISVFCAYVDRYLTYSHDMEGATPSRCLQTGSSVCEGYTAFLNGLCQAAGLPLKAQFGTANDENHVWSRLDTESGPLYTDATWADSRRGEANMTRQQLLDMDPTRTFCVWSAQHKEE